MEKETTTNSEHGKTCRWCGMDKGFSWTRLVLAILIGMFLFLLGIRIGQMGGSRMMERGTMRNSRYMMNDNNDTFRTRTLVIPAPALEATPTAPATTTPAVPAQQ